MNNQPEKNSVETAELERQILERENEVRNCHATMTAYTREIERLQSLIAAAPELLGALEGLIKMIRQARVDERLDTAVAALAKARQVA